MYVPAVAHAVTRAMVMNGSPPPRFTYRSTTITATPMKIADSIGVLVLGCTYPKKRWNGIILSRPYANNSRDVAAWMARQQTKMAMITDTRNASVTHVGKCALKM